MRPKRRLREPVSGGEEDGCREMAAAAQELVGVVDGVFRTVVSYL